MSGFYRGAVGDWFRNVVVAMVTEAEPRIEEEAEAVETPAPTDFVLSYRAVMVPCGNCDCPGCYDCTSDIDEPCECLVDVGIDLSDEVVM